MKSSSSQHPVTPNVSGVPPPHGPGPGRSHQRLSKVSPGGRQWRGSCRIPRLAQGFLDVVGSDTCAEKVRERRSPRENEARGGFVRHPAATKLTTGGPATHAGPQLRPKHPSLCTQSPCERKAERDPPRQRGWEGTALLRGYSQRGALISWPSR